MPRYEVTLSDGTTHQIDGPKGATEAQIISAVETLRLERETAADRKRYTDYLKERAEPKPDPEDTDTTLLGNIARGLGAGFVDTLENSALGIATLLDEGAELTARDIIKGVAEDVRPHLANPDEISAKLARGVGSILGFVPAALAGPAAPAVIAGMAVSGGAGEASERARAKGATQAERNRAAFQGMAPGALDIIPFARLGRKIAKIPGASNVVPKGAQRWLDKTFTNAGPAEISGARSRVLSAFKTGGLEGAQEAAQGVAQNWIEQGYNADAKLFGPEVPEEGGIGFGAGFIVQGLLDAFVGRRRGATPGETEPTEEVDQAPPPVPAGIAGLLPPPRGPADAPDIIYNPDETINIAGLLPSPAESIGPERQLSPPPMRMPDETGGETISLPDESIPASQIRIAELESVVADAERNIGRIENAPIAPFETAQEDPIFTPIETEQNRIRLAQEEINNIRQRPQEFEAAQAQRVGRQEEELLASVPTQDVDAELRRAIGDTTPTTPMAVAAQEALARREAEPTPTPVVEPTPAPTPAVEPEVIPTQASLPDMGRPFSAKAARPAVTPASEPRILDETIFNEVGLPAKAPIRKRLLGKDFNNPNVRQDLATLAGRPKTSQKTKSGINRLLSASPAEQTDIWATKKLTASAKDDVPPTPLTASAEGDVSPTVEQVPTEETVETGAADAEQFELFGEPVGTPEPISRTDRESVPDTVVQQPRRGTTPTGRDTAATEVPAAPRVDDVEANVRSALGRTGEQLSAIKAEPVPTAEEVVQAADRKKGKKAAKKVKEAAAKRKTLTKEAEEFLVAAKKGMPASVTNNLRRIAEENNVKVTKTTKPEDIVDAFKKKKAAAKKTTTKAKKASVPDAPKKKAAEKPFETKTDEDGNPITIVPEGASVKKKRRSSPKKKQLDIEVGERADLTSFTAAQPSSARRFVTTTDEDVAKVDALVRSKRARAEQRGTTKADKAKAAARIYFGRKDDPIEALEEIAHESVFADAKFRTSAAYTAAANTYFANKGKNRAEQAIEWVRANLDPATVKSMDDFIAAEKIAIKRGVLDPDADIDVVKEVGHRRSAMSDAWLAADEKQMAAHVKAELTENLAYVDGINTEEEVTSNDLKELLSDTNQVAGLDLPIHPVVNNLLRSNKLKEALQTLAITSPSSRVSQVAAKLAQKLGDTKVEVVEDLEKDVVIDLGGGESVISVPLPGSFDPETNTIKLHSYFGMNFGPHTILHEVTHALTSATLDKKSHPVTKQLEKLFNDVKDQLGTAYGAQSVDEFVAEAFGNPEFQQMLASMNPKGRPISALQQFSNIIGNFVRRMLGMQTKPVDSALNKADQFIEAILAPAPQHRNTPKMYEMSADSIMDGLDKVSKSFPKLTPRYRKDFVNYVKDTIPRLSPVAVRTLTRFAGLQALADIASAYGFKSAYELDNLVKTMIGRQNLAEQRVDASYQLMKDWLKAKNTTDAMRKSFNNLVYTSTTKQVDPYAPSTKYKGDKLKAWKEMQGDRRAIGPGGKKTYERLRETYRTQFNELQKVIIERIDTLKNEKGEPVDKKQREKLKKDVFNKIFEKGRIEPYFPLTREGDKWLEFKGTNGEMVYMAFKTNTERNAFRQGIQNDELVDKESIREYSNIEEARKGMEANQPAGAFVTQTLSILQKNNVDTDVQNQFLELFLNALPESSFARSLTRRGNEGAGKEGYDVDAESAFRQKAYNMASQIERMRYSKQIDDVMAKLKGELAAISQKTKKDTPHLNQIYNELQAHAQFAKNPPSDKIAATLNRLAFMGTIGFSVSSALVNGSQIPLFFAPMLTGKYGLKANTAIFHAGRLITASGFKRVGTSVIGENVELKGMPSIDNYYTVRDIKNKKGDVIDTVYEVRNDIDLTSDKRKELEDMAPLIKRASKEGQLSKSLFYDTVGAELSGREKGAMDYANAGQAFMFHQMERFNSQVALVSTYQLELDRMRKEKIIAEADAQGLRGAAKKQYVEEKYGSKSREDIAKIKLSEEQYVEAAREAIFKKQEMNGGAFLATAPSISQKGWGRVAMMYKGFGMQMYYTILKTGRQAFVVDLVENLKKEGIPAGVAKTMGQTAFKQLVFLMGSSVALSGVAGLPFIGMFMGLADLFLDDDEEDAATIIRKGIGEGWYKGGVNALTGVDVASRIGLGNLLFRLNPYSQDQSTADVFMQMVGGPAWSVGSQMKRGFEMAIDGDLRRGTEMMLPAAFRNVVKGSRYLDEGTALTRRGDPIVDDIGLFHSITQMTGFAPANYTLQQEKNMTTKKIEKAVNKERSNLLKKYWVAVRMGDTEEARDIIRDITKFNRKHRNFSISAETVHKSVTTHARTSAGMEGGITMTPKMRGVLRQHQDEYWGDDLMGFYD